MLRNSSPCHCFLFKRLAAFSPSLIVHSQDVVPALQFPVVPHPSALLRASHGVGEERGKLVPLGPQLNRVMVEITQPILLHPRAGLGWPVCWHLGILMEPDAGLGKIQPPLSALRQCLALIWGEPSAPWSHCLAHMPSQLPKFTLGLRETYRCPPTIIKCVGN